MGDTGVVKAGWAEQGMALFMTLALITVMAAAALEMNRWTGRWISAAAGAADRFQAEETALSGIHLAMLVLDMDAQQQDGDSIQEAWASPSHMAAAVAALEMGKDHELTLSITDEMGKIQINALVERYPGHTVNPDQRALWERLLDGMISADKSMDGRDPSEMINSLKDWLDSGDDDAVTGLTGAEAPHYRALFPPVQCANAPLATLGELFSVRGFSRESLQWDKNRDNDLGALAELAEYTDPSRVFTVHGMSPETGDTGRYFFPGRININTAPVAVLSAMLPERLRDQAPELVDFREEGRDSPDGFINALDKGWYEQVISLGSEEKKKFERIITYSSFLFRAVAHASVNGQSVILTGIIQRETDAETGTGFCRLLELTRE